MLISEFAKDLETRLSIGSFSDISLNGLQISGPDKEIRKSSFAVDASFDTIDRAVENGSDILVVHHGLFWGSPIAITGSHYRRVKRAIDGGLSLFACHIPLDAHPLYGNNAQMALALGMESYDPFCTFRGSYVGYKGRLPFPMTVEEVARLLGFSRDSGLRILKFGKDMVETVGIVSGAAGDDVEEAIAEGLDLFITGELPHAVYSTVKENGINMIAGGHYRSEVFGVKALERLARKEFGIETEFIDAETGL
ncbi:MAG: Nif3-like dinuclear metal center hexameric protein [Candidatus Ornithospirochaeta sp.]|nr:Nif3-like dinuclear metal center hexameric protein [Candidatus Ornithospirochaeta sp.]